MYKNLKKVLSSKVWLFWIITGFLIIFLISYTFTNFSLLVWNYWTTFAYFNLFLDIIVSTLFWFFAWASLYKIVSFSDFSTSSTILWTIWWFFGILISWCPTCTVTIASHLSIATIFTSTFTFYWTEIKIFPFNWLELKILSVLILTFAIRKILIELEVCRVKFKA